MDSRVHLEFKASTDNACMHAWISCSHDYEIRLVFKSLLGTNIQYLESYCMQSPCINWGEPERAPHYHVYGGKSTVVDG